MVVPAPVGDLEAEVGDPLDHLAAVAPVVVAQLVVAMGADSCRDFDRGVPADRETGRESWHPVVEDDTVAADCRDEVVEPIPAGARYTAAEADRAVVAAVGLAVVPVDPDPLEVVAEVGSGRNCWDSDAGRAVAVDAIGATN